MNNNYKIHNPTLYDTGFLKDDSISRMKQGLDPQGLASYAYIYMSPDALNGNPYFNNVVYPVKGLSPDYSTDYLSPNCVCLQKLYGTIGNQK